MSNCCRLVCKMELKHLLLLPVLSYITAAPPVRNDPAYLTLLTDAVSKGAVCLDGSPSGYYFRPGTGTGINKWLLYLEGGGWCAKGVDECYGRSFNSFGSSTKWANSTLSFAGAFSSNKTINPAFYNWNMVQFMYCDGASFSADREEPDVYKGKKLYYRGFKTLTAIMEDLNMNKNLNRATDVVLTGSSAGGLAVYMHMNYIQTLIPHTARFSGLPDAGFFLDVPKYTKDPRNSVAFYNMTQFMGISNGLMEDCKNDNPGEMIWKCMFAPYIYKYIKAPVFVLNSRDDSTQLRSENGLPCLPPSCNSSEMEYFHFFEKEFKEQVGVVTNNPATGSGYFLDSCLVHVQSKSDSTWSKTRAGGRSISEAVYDWYYNSAEIRIDDCDYPCNPTCAKRKIRERQ